jgi:hypothetical protein
MTVDLSTYGGELLESGYPGSLVDLNPATITNHTNDGDEPIRFGFAVARSASDRTCKAPESDTDAIIGIAVRHVTFAATADGEVFYKKTATLPVLRAGFIYATATEATERDDAVISITAEGGALGSETGGAAGAGRVHVPGAAWETKTPAGGLGVVRLK